jgi:hypothetical protein
MSTRPRSRRPRTAALRASSTRTARRRWLRRRHATQLVGGLNRLMSKHIARRARAGPEAGRCPYGFDPSSASAVNQLIPPLS